MSVCMDLFFFLFVSVFIQPNDVTSSGFSPDPITGALLLDPAGGLSSPNPLPLPFPNQNPGSSPAVTLLFSVSNNNIRARLRLSLSTFQNKAIRLIQNFGENLHQLQPSEMLRSVSEAKYCGYCELRLQMGKTM